MRGVLIGLPASLALWGVLAFAGFSPWGTTYAAGPGGENAIDLSAYPTRSDLAAALQQSLPQAATATPPATNLDGTLGTSALYARADHTHAVRVQRVAMTTATDGTVTWTFARAIVVPTGKVPPLAYMVEDTGSPVVVQVTSRTFMTDATAGMDTHTAVTVRAQRSRTLPATLVSLAALVNFDVFGLAASGVRVNLWVADPTQ